MVERLPTGDSGGQDDFRLRELGQWLAQFGELADADVRPASADASFRRYFRVRTEHMTCIAMDAPPPQEDCGPFVRVAGFLGEMGIHAPRVLEADPQRGFLLLTDLGSRRYLDELAERPERVDELYADALATLLRIQVEGRRFQDRLPPYGETLLKFEVSLFRDWLCGRHLGLRFSKGEEADWQRCVDILVDSALRQPKVFVHRDYHSRNLMVTPVDNPGVLDFQDAVEGPVTYDLVSLLKDCYIRWPAQRVREWALGFYASAAKAGILASGDPDGFLRNFELMGVQRHLKAAGIFARLWHRDGKPAYLEDVPRTLTYVHELGPRHPELEFLVRLIGERCLPALERLAAVAEPAQR